MTWAELKTLADEVRRLQWDKTKAERAIRHGYKLIDGRTGEQALADAEAAVTAFQTEHVVICDWCGKSSEEPSSSDGYCGHEESQKNWYHLTIGGVPFCDWTGCRTHLEQAEQAGVTACAYSNRGRAMQAKRLLDRQRRSMGSRSTVRVTVVDGLCPSAIEVETDK
jgi:hypothetical protein